MFLPTCQETYYITNITKAELSHLPDCLNYTRVFKIAKLCTLVCFNLSQIVNTFAEVKLQ